MRIEFIILLTVGLILISGWFLYQKELKELQPCIDKWSNKRDYKEKSYIPGEFIVEFSSNITKDEAEDFIKSKGLTIKSGLYVFENIGEFGIIDGLVDVPNGTEIIWMCRFEKEGIDVGFNGYTGLTE